MNATEYYFRHPFVFTEKDITLCAVEHELPTIDLQSLVCSGTKLLDAFIWLRINRPRGVTLAAKKLWTDKEAMNAFYGARVDLSMLVLWTVSAGGYPTMQHKGMSIPTVFALIFPGRTCIWECAERLCSFDIWKLSYKWLTEYPLEGIPKSLWNHVVESAAEYMYFKVFDRVPTSKKLDAQQKRAINFCLHVNHLGPNWDMWPGTRSAVVSHYMPSVLKCLKNLISEVYTKSEIEYMVTMNYVPKDAFDTQDYINDDSWKTFADNASCLQLSRPMLRNRPTPPQWIPKDDSYFDRSAAVPPSKLTVELINEFKSANFGKVAEIFVNPDDAKYLALHEYVEKHVGTDNVFKMEMYKLHQYLEAVEKVYQYRLRVDPPGM